MRKTLPIATLAAFLVLAVPGCSGAKPVEPPAPAPHQTGVFGASVTLTVGQQVRYPDGLQVFLEKIDDSRCPAGSVCVWQGELAPLLRLEGGSIATEHELRLGTVRAVNGAAGGYAIALGEATATTATIVVTHGDPNVGSEDDRIRVTSPTGDQLVASPLTVSGAARGSWYFEASFPVKLLDAKGKLLVERPAQAQGEWMTPELVPFEVVLEFAAPETATGTLVLQKDNPSGLAEHDDSRTIPVRFTAAAPAHGCRRAGCSGEVCSDQDVASACIYRPEFACYKSAACERQADGKCGWTATPALTSCLAAPPRQAEY